MPQYGFYFDQSCCTGCKTCSVACKNLNGLPPGPLKYLRVYEYEKGSFPDIRLHYRWIPCYHCEQPSCIDACPVDAIYKEDKYGAVLIDQEACTGCRQCYELCPYGAPVFESDAPDVPAQKCNMCIDRLEQGENPQCVMSCPTRALDFGTLESLQQTYGDRRDLEDMPDSQMTRPAVIVTPSTAKRQLVPYDGEKAMKLMMRRDPLPPLFTSVLDNSQLPPGTIARDHLVIKHESAHELMRCTRSDEG